MQSMSKRKSTEKIVVKNIPKTKNTTSIKKSDRSFKEMGAFLDSLGNRLPKDYKFNRDEANER